MNLCKPPKNAQSSASCASLSLEPHNTAPRNPRCSPNSLSAPCRTFPALVPHTVTGGRCKAQTAARHKLSRDELQPSLVLRARSLRYYSSCERSDAAQTYGSAHVSSSLPSKPCSCKSGKTEPCLALSTTCPTQFVKLRKAGAASGFAARYTRWRLSERHFRPCDTAAQRAFRFLHAACSGTRFTPRKDHRGREPRRPSLTHAISHQVEVPLLLAAGPARPAGQGRVRVAAGALRVRGAAAGLAGRVAGWGEQQRLLRSCYSPPYALPSPERQPLQYRSRVLLQNAGSQKDPTAPATAKLCFGRLLHPSF